MQIPQILIVEDDLALAEAVELKLRHAGFLPIVASSAEIAMRHLAEHIPDLIWLDVLLPGMSGIDLLEHLRANQKFKDIPVLIVSVSTSPEKMKRAFELNIIDFISKSDNDIKTVVGRVGEYFAQNAQKQG